MGLNDNHRRLAWVPQACTLPRFKRPFRAAEFDRLFTDAVRDIERVGPTRLRLELEASPGVAGRAAKLAPAEPQGRPFLHLTATRTAGAAGWVGGGGGGGAPPTRPGGPPPSRPAACALWSRPRRCTPRPGPRCWPPSTPRAGTKTTATARPGPG